MAINDAAKDWGLKCLRYEIRDINPPRGVRAAMEMQAEAERKKRAQILESEGVEKGRHTLIEQMVRRLLLSLPAEGEAESIFARANATSRGIRTVARSLKEHGGVEAASLRVVEQYVTEFGKLAKESTTLMLPANPADPASMMAQAMAIYKSVIGNNARNGLPEISRSSFSKSIKDEANFEENERDSITSGTTVDANDPGEPVFSLQKSKKKN